MWHRLKVGLRGFYLGSRLRDEQLVVAAELSPQREHRKARAFCKTFRRHLPTKRIAMSASVYNWYGKGSRECGRAANCPKLQDL